MRDYAKAESLFRMALRANPDNTIPLPNLMNEAVAQGKHALVDSLLVVEQRDCRTISTTRTIWPPSRRTPAITTEPSGFSTA